MSKMAAETAQELLLVNPNPARGPSLLKLGAGVTFSIVLSWLLLSCGPCALCGGILSGIVAILTALWVIRLVSRCYPQMYPAHDKGVLITGCDTGFGYWLALRLDSLGCVVFAGCLSENGPGAAQLRNMGSERMRVLQMDVTSQKQVDECLADVKEALEEESLSGLWGIVNNAGVNFLGDTEITTMGQFEKICQVNQLGYVRVTKTFLPLVRKVKGRVVNVTSVKGLFPLPFNAAYGMTKFAGEAFTCMLRQEMAPFGVKVVAIQPCNFGGVTGCLEMNRIRRDFEVMWRDMDEELRQTYGKDYLDFHVKAAEDAIPSASREIYKVLDAMMEGLLAVNPQYSYLIRGGTGRYDLYQIRAKYYPLLPQWVLDWDLRREMAGSFPLPASLRTAHKQTY